MAAVKEAMTRELSLDRRLWNKTHLQVEHRQPAHPLLIVAARGFKTQVPDGGSVSTMKQKSTLCLLGRAGYWAAIRTWALPAATGYYEDDYKILETRIVI